MSEKGDIENLQIPELERQNLKELFTRLKDSAERSKYTIETEVVGGAVKKAWPRKDIDVRCVVEGPMLEMPKNLPALMRARFYFGILEDIVQGAIKDSRFEIEKETKPYEDPEFNDPNILFFDGSIVVKPKEGTKIELLNKNV